MIMFLKKKMKQKMTKLIKDLINKKKLKMITILNKIQRMNNKMFKKMKIKMNRKIIKKKVVKIKIFHQINLLTIIV